MGELTTQLSSWPGSLDTALALSDGPGGDSPKASHINGVIDAVLKLQADLGIGLKGSVADLKTRLAANISAVGGLLSGTVFPGSPTPLQLFWRTDTKQLHVYDDALGQWPRVDSTNIHSALGGLLADDHPQYAEVAAAETISGAWNFTTTPSLPVGSIGSTEIADGSIVNGDVSPSAGIVDTKLATIATPGKVSNTALSADVAFLNAAQSFLQNQTLQSLFPQLILETTGQTAQARVIEVDNRAFLAWNAYQDATGWQRDDTTTSSWLLGMGAGNGDVISAFYSAAGTGIIVFSNILTFDNSGSMSIGTVPGARVQANTITGSHIVANSIVSTHIPAGQIISSHIPSAQIIKSHLNTATGGASGSLGPNFSAEITLNSHSFFPNIGSNTGLMEVQAFTPTTGTTDAGRFALINRDSVARTYNVQWLYITASDKPTVHVVYDSSGNITGVWMSDDPLPTGMLGLSQKNRTSTHIPRQDLIVALTGIPISKIQAGRRKSSSEDRAPYRIMHEAFSDPPTEIIKRCKIIGGKLAAR